MNLLRLGIPLAIFAFILYKSRTRPIYFTLIPWLVGLGRAIFIDILPDSIVVGNLFGFQISVQDVLFGLVIIVWGYSCRQRKASVHFFTRSSTWIIILWFLLLFVEEIFAITNSSIPVGFRSLFDTRLWFYLPLSFMLFVDTYKRYDREEFMEALGTFSWIVAGVTVLYILDYGLGWNIIYPYEKSYLTLIGSDATPREFYFSFFWLGIVFSYLLVMPRSIFVSLTLLAIILLGIFFSYTRSVIIIVLLMVVIAGILLLIKSMMGMSNKRSLEKKDASSQAVFTERNQATLKNITPSRLRVLLILLVILPGFALLLFLILPILLPTQWDYLVTRFSEVLAIGSQGVSSVPNFSVRWNSFTSAWNDGKAFDPWLGSGLILSSSTFSWMSYDSDWIHIVFRFGIVGVVVFMLPLIWSQWLALTAFFARRDKKAERLALIILLFNVFIFLQRFWGVIYLWWYPLSTLGIALAVVEADQLWKKEGNNDRAKN